MSEPALVLVSPDPGWAAPAFDSLLPGAHALVLGDVSAGLDARRTGFEFRDTLTVLSAGPRVRHAFLFRRPLAEATILAQVMATGTGAINVGGSRVDGKRWPTNLVFVHGPGCKAVGTKRVVASNAPGRASRGGGERAIGFGKNTGNAAPMPFYTDPDDYGMEVVTAYKCEPGCPVAALDAQSGVLKNGGQNESSTRGLGVFDPQRAWMGALGSTTFAGDSGGASRFFPQFRDETELLAWLTTLITPPQFSDDA